MGALKNTAACFSSSRKLFRNLAAMHVARIPQPDTQGRGIARHAGEFPMERMVYWSDAITMERSLYGRCHLDLATFHVAESWVLPNADLPNADLASEHLEKPRVKLPDWIPMDSVEDLFLWMLNQGPTSLTLDLGVSNSATLGDVKFQAATLSADLRDVMLQRIGICICCTL